MPVVVNNIQEIVDIPKQTVTLLKELGDYSMRLEGVPENYEVSITFVDDNYIHELNLTYLGRDHPTDVLAFNLAGDDDSNTTDHTFEEEKILGDVIISLERAVEQSDRYGHSLKREVAFLTVHGILHLLGYDHEAKEEEEEMKGKQEYLLSRFNL